MFVVHQEFRFFVETLIVPFLIFRGQRLGIVQLSIYAVPDVW